MAKKLFVGGLSWDTTDASLSAFFAQAGSVATASVVMDKYTGKSRGFGFVEMATEEEAQKAVQQLSGQSLDGRPVTVNEARPQEPRTGGGGFGGGGGGGFRGGDRDRGGRGGGGRGDRGGGRY